MRIKISYGTRRSIPQSGSLSQGNCRRSANERMQCKNKMANLTRKYKTVKDKLRTTGYGKGGDDELDKETESETDLIPKNFNEKR